MTATNLWNIDWLNANSQRNYPLCDEATGKDTTGTVELPTDFLVDLVLTIPSITGAEPGLFHLYSVAIFSGGVVVTLGYDGDPIAVASASVSGHTVNTAYRLVGQGDVFYDAVGTLVIGKLDSILASPAGLYTFDLTGGRLEPCTIHPDVRGISSVRVSNGSDLSEPMYGDIILVAGTNVRLEASPSRNEIRFDCLIKSAGDLETACDCQKALAVGPICTINGIAPDANGNFTLQRTACLDVQSLDHGVKLVDLCSQPCCGCEELTVFKTDLDFVLNLAATLNSQVDQMSVQITNVTNIILASKLGTCTP